MSERETMSGRLVAGVALILLGVVLLVDRLFVVELVRGVVRGVGIWWPSLYIALGLALLLVWKIRRKGIAYALIVFGAVVQIAKLDIFWWWSGRTLLPIFLIVLGVWLLLARLRPAPAVQPQQPAEFAGPKGEDAGESIDAFVIFGGLERASTSRQFRGGEASAVFGGIDLDLRRAELAPGEQRLKLFALFGGIEVSVPQTWQVSVHGTPILGSVEDSRKATPSPPEQESPPPAGRLLVDGFALFGGIEVKT
jgi:predicted membrane protein